MLNLKERPFLPFWPTIEKIEKQREAGSFSGDCHRATEQLVLEITTKAFISEAKQTHAVLEIAKFYDHPLGSDEDLKLLFDCVA